MKKLKSLLSLLVLGLLVSCGGGSDPTVNPTDGPTDTPTETPTEQPTEGPTEEPTQEPIGFIPLEDAVANTRVGYSIAARGFGYDHHIENYIENKLYANYLQRYGAVVLDEDPSFAHQFNIGIATYSEIVKHEIEMKGRVGDTSIISSFKERTFFSVLDTVLDQFVAVEDQEGSYVFKDQGAGFVFKDFFQSNSIKYCNEFEIVLDEYGYLKYFHAFEEFNGERTPVGTYVIESLKDYKTLEVFEDWAEKGSPISVGIADYKYMYKRTLMGDPVSVYEGYEVEIEGVVSAVDTENNLYISYFDEMYGYPGIKVPGKGEGFEPLDTVKVKGKIYTANLTVMIGNAEVTDLGVKSDYLPVYNEEAGISNYGGGFYLAQLFLNNPPLYGSSVYSTYGHVKSYEKKSETVDTIINICYPSVVDPNTNEPLTVEFVIPKGLNSEVKDAIYAEVEKAGTYGSFVSKELCFENTLLVVDVKAPYLMKLEATNNTSVFAELSTQQKVEKTIGLKNFPIVDAENETSFRFGIRDTIYIEDYYNLDKSNPTTGIFIAFGGIELTAYETYIKTLENYGFVMFEEVRDKSSRIGQVYQYGEDGTFLHVFASKSDYAETVSIEMFIYNKAEALLPPLIEERIITEFGDILPEDLFVRAANTYDADYEIFKLTQYADITYTDENPLYCLAISVDSPAATNEYAKLFLREKGFKQYKVNNSITSYTTRGQKHTILQKDDLFIDLACYHTSDYTYYGHQEFEYRLEVLIYKGTKPLSIKIYDDIKVLSGIYGALDPQYDYGEGLVLPDDAKVEYWKDTGDFDNVTYGYGSRDEVFIYTSDTDTAYDNLVAKILECGYKQSIDKPTRAAFSKTINGEGCYIAILKEPEKGYVRVMNDVLGASFNN